MSSNLNDTTCIIYLIRHGATDNNLANPPRLQGRKHDPGLSVEGREQARRTGRLLANYPIAGVYSSPLLRAMETAELIALPHSLPVQPVEDLIEVDVGRWEGRSWDDIQQNDPEAYRRFSENPAEHGYAGGENFQQVQDRVAPVFEKLMTQNLGKRIVAVGHNIVIRTFLARLLELPASKAMLFGQTNCGMNVIRLRKGRIQLRTLNAAFHLEDR